MLAPKFDHYWVFSEVESALKEWVAAYPNLCKLESAGKSGEGRDIWAVTMTNRATGCPCAKSAFYFDGNHHAGEVTGSMISMYTIKQLFHRGGIFTLAHRLISLLKPKLPSGQRMSIEESQRKMSTKEWTSIPVPSDNPCFLAEGVGQK